ncbi:MAG: nitrate reductase gamma subunit [Gammaproteobacteria bacterium]
MTIFFAIAFYFAAVVMTLGLGHKIYQYWSTPAPFRIPITPAPSTLPGVVLRMLAEIFLFKSLFKANKWIWILGWVFHASLGLVMLQHIVYFQQQPPVWIYQLQPYTQFAAYPLLVSLSGLLLRRFMVDRIRYISSPSDFLMLFLLIVIASSGLLMMLFWTPNLYEVQQYFTGLLRLTINPLPDHLLLYLHLLLVVFLLLIFPFSKLLHAPGIFFSPTLNQADNARKKPHPSPKTGNDNNG